MSVTFKNRENECVKTEDGRTVWLSRACAVVAEVCLFNQEEQEWYVLIGKRGPGTPDFQGYWCLPCGYLDWDETLTGGMIREVWEECGVFLPGLSAHDAFIYSPNACTSQQDCEEAPWLVSDRPKPGKQNISFHYGVVFSWAGGELPALTAENCEPDEVSDLAWKKLGDVLEMELAFNHTAKVQQFFSEKADLLESVKNYSK